MVAEMAKVPNPSKRAQTDPVAWADRITAAWLTGVEAFIETGRLLIEAKKKVEPGEWLAMVRERLPFKESTAERLMAVARHPVLSDPAQGRIYQPHGGHCMS
jgi:hypothetical protein